jgi:putative methyltransferase (TIGR04325 family)
MRKSGSINFLKSFAIACWIREKFQRMRFLSKKSLFTYYGVFESFEDARKNLPATEEFNKRQLAEEYVTVRMNRIFTYDYPVMYWLAGAFASGATSVFDLGGSVGVHFHSYRKFMHYPDKLRWIVCETPEISQVGRELAETRGMSEIVFVDRLEPSRIKCNIWICAGALQYIENGRPKELLKACASRPEHIILNKLPLYDGDDFVVAQNIGEGCFAPAYVYGKSRFIEEIESMGYMLMDLWDVPERDLYVPGVPEKSFSSFSGLYFRRIITCTSTRPVTESIAA